MVPAGSPSALAGAAAARAIVMEPTFERIDNHDRDAGAPGTVKGAFQPAGWGSDNPSGYTPAQIQSAYGMTGVGNGAGQTIAIVDAYDDPAFVDSSAAGYSNSDLAKFDQNFGLPNPPSFIKLNEYGSATNLPGVDPAGAGNAQGNWEVEEALDVEWAHAIAPGANIVLVECNSGNSADMFQGVVTAAGIPDVSVVSMSWGSGEFSGETFYDSDFTTPAGHQGVTFVASTGDQGSPGDYPAYSPNVLAVGGTSLYLSANGSYGSETAWSGSGGGTSGYETKPAYQDGVAGTAGRSIPDVSSDANPNTGVAVYDSYNGGSATPWEQVGGTSVAAPTWAGLIALADGARVAAGHATLNGESETLPAIYSISSGDYHDITTGGNGGESAGPGYDEVTGLGSPRANLLVSDLAAYDLTTKLVVSAEPPASVKAGASFGFSVAVENAAGILEQNFNGSIMVSLGNNPGGGTLGGTLTVTAQDGVARFSGLTLATAGSGYTLQATFGQNVATTSSFTVTPATPARLAVISEPPVRIGVNQAFGVSVAVLDQFGNLETGYSGTVTLSLESGPSGGAFGGTLTVPVQNGVAVFTGLKLNRVGLGYSIKAVSHEAIASAQTTLFGVVTNLQTTVRVNVKVAHEETNVKVHRHATRPARHA
jgi:subtilase family serine protease